MVLLWRCPVVATVQMLRLAEARVWVQLALVLRVVVRVMVGLLGSLQRWTRSAPRSYQAGVGL